MFWIYSFAVYACGQNRFFTLYLDFFQVPETLQWFLKKKNKIKTREQLGNSIFLL